MVDRTKLEIYKKVPVKYLNSEYALKKSLYSWQGEIPITQITPKDDIVIIDTFAYWARHQSDGVIKRIKTGDFPLRGNNICLKIMGIIRDNKLYVTTKSAKPAFKDIAPMEPIRVGGLGQALKIAEKHFSSPELPGTSPQGSSS